MVAPSVTTVTFEQHHDGFGIGCDRPRLSWRFVYSAETIADWKQTAYQLEISKKSSEHPKMYTVESEQSLLVPWPSTPLRSRELAVVRVRICGEQHGGQRGAETWTDWSEASTVEVGLLERSDWAASFITSAEEIGPRGPLQPIRFRTQFTLPKNQGPIAQSRLYITAFGVFDVYINGQLVSNECMAPGWTVYKHRLNYRTLDVSTYVEAGQQNVIGIEVAEGWYAGRLGFKAGKRFIYGKELAVLAQLETIFEDRSESRLASDDTWTCAPSAIQLSEIYNGELYDHREETLSWIDPSDYHKQSSPSKTKLLPWPACKLVSSDAPPLRIVGRRQPVKIFTSKSGRTIIDLGQNMVGKLLVKSITLPEGARLTFKHAEVMENGELGTRPLRFADATDTIIGAGKELKDWTPRFTFHGFRFVEVGGWPGELSANDFEALVLHSDMKRRGWFTCSNASVNQLHQNALWSMKGNFLSIPTDCPQRDERLGWTGDLQVFCPSASFLYDTVGLLGNWMEDVAAEQLEEGRGSIPPVVVPDVVPANWHDQPHAIWDDVTVLTPDVLYKYSADRSILERQFISMQAWLNEGVDRAPDGLWNNERWQLGDWLDPAAPPEDPGNGRTDNWLVANAYLVHVTEVFSDVCRILGKSDLAAKYAADAARLRSRFQHKYVTPAGNLMSNTQTGVSLAIQFGLYPDHEKLQVAASSLGKLVQYARFRIATGFAGTPVITHALTSVGLSQLAYRMLLEKKCPSWMYPVSMGATTIWERWDSMLPDGSINPGQMTSFNHYALGAVVDWLHTSVGGISPLEPGWKVIRARPVPGGNLTSAEVKFDGPYGVVKCEWTWKRQEDRLFEMVLSVPPNSSAVVTLPSELKRVVTDTAVVEKSRIVGSGVHRFSCAYDAGEWPPRKLVASHIVPPGDDIAE